MILVTGAGGQIGSDLVEALRERCGEDDVLATDLTSPGGEGPGEALDVTDRPGLRKLVERRGVETVYHLAGLLSAVGEKHPDRCWEVNVNGLRNVLELAQSHGLRVFWPSSIAVFGPYTPRRLTPQVTVEDPRTMYGITKVTGELLCDYYARKLGVDVRSLRLPGIISYTTPPGGGTTDYAVEMFYAALRDEAYTCFVRPETRLPMMYMPDTLRAILLLMDADAADLHVHSSYNITGLSFSAEELAAAIRERRPSFTVRYEPDFRQAIADTWPTQIDDSHARADWGWRPAYDLDAIVDDMLAKLGARLGANAKTSPSAPKTLVQP